jgi:hypothetical protein
LSSGATLWEAETTRGHAQASGKITTNYGFMAVITDFLLLLLMGRRQN